MYSYLTTYLFGVLTGTAGKYLADKYTDKRRKKESTDESRKQFCQIASKMPELIQEMQKSLRKPAFSIIREFFILPNRRVSFIPGQSNTLLYYEEDHNNLMHKIKLLINNGYLEDVTYTNTPKFSMSEEFVTYVLKSKFKSGLVKI